LILDKRLAKKSQHILFLKIENDGFDLGAQRREIDKNDLPSALQTLEAYKECLSNEKAFEDLPSLATLVEKSVILANREIVLSGDRYLSDKEFHTEFDRVKLVDVLDYEQPTKYIVETENYNDNFKTPVLTAGKTFILGYTDETKGIFKEDLPVIIFDDFTTATKFVDFHFKVKSSAMKILKAKRELAEIKYLYYMMQQIEFNASEHKRFWISQYSQLEIPLPPLEIQQQIVAEIEGYQKIIDGAKQIVYNYKPTIIINPAWAMVELGSLAKIKGGYAFKSDEFVDSGIQVLKISNVKTGRLDLEKNAAFIHLERKNEFAKYVIKAGDILITMTGTEGKRDYGDVCLVANKGEYLFNQRVGKVELNSQ
jgi:restriction endonuclease S subunit